MQKSLFLKIKTESTDLDPFQIWLYLRHEWLFHEGTPFRLWDRQEPILYGQKLIWPDTIMISKDLESGQSNQ